METHIYSASAKIDEKIFSSALKTDYDFLWIRENSPYNMVGFGTLVSHETFGTHRISELHHWWKGVSRETRIVAFMSSSFDKESFWGAQLVVPRILIEPGRCTVYSLTPVDETDVQAALTSLSATSSSVAHVTLTSQSLSDNAWKTKVHDALALMETSELEKVVLSRQLNYESATEISSTALTHRLLHDYPACWTFAFRGTVSNQKYCFIGATPEMLIEAHSGTVQARVLAGTQSRVNHATPELLEHSSKELFEHRLAVESLRATLTGSSTTDNNISVQGPFVLELPNVWHLASDVKVQAEPGFNILELLEHIHPTAAVGGTPTALAVDTIRTMENYDRGPYAGPIGWVDSNGNGQCGLALRCGLVHDNTISLYAGCGIVQGSIPENELAETNDKLQPMLQALGL